MRNKRNYYRILHVQPDAPLDLIRMSYRTMMQKMRMHPDLGGDEWDAAVINEAYAVLSNKQKRSEYDVLLFSSRSKSETGHQNESQRASSESNREAERETEVDPEPTQFEEKQNKTEMTGSEKETKTTPFAAAGAERSCVFCNNPVYGIPDQHSDCSRCHSPVMPISPQHYDVADKRKILRISANMPLGLTATWQGERYQGNLRNLSLNGLQFSTSALLGMGSYIRIECLKFIAVVEIRNHNALENNQHVYGSEFFSLRFLQESGSFVHTKV